MSIDFENDLLLIIAASGKIASYVFPLVSLIWKRIHLLCNSKASKERLQKEYPQPEVLALELLDWTKRETALRNVTACVYRGPSFHPHETKLGYNVIDAAVTAAGVRSDGRAALGRLASVSTRRGDPTVGTFERFVFSGVINTLLRKLLKHDCNRYVEEYLMESELDFTILQPTQFMQNFLPLAKPAIEEYPVYLVTYSPQYKKY